MVAGNLASGVITPTADSFNLSVNLSGYDGVFNTFYVGSSGLSGAFTSNLPIDLASGAETGNPATSFRDIYYNHLWIIPSFINFGRILSPQMVEIFVWNSFFENRAFGPVDATGDENGQVLTGDTGAGTFNALQAKTYTLSIATVGSSKVNVIYDWQMQGSGDTFSVLQILGSRLTAFLLRHNWKSPVSEQLAFKTHIITGISGKEQGIKLRQSPRRRIEMEYLTLTPEERMYLEHVSMGQHLTFAVPLWSDTQLLGASVPAGTTVFQVNTTDRDYEVGSFFFIQSADGEMSEVLEIASFTASSVTSTEPSVNAFGVGARVCPARFGILEREFGKMRHTSTIENVVIAWQLDTDTDSPNLLKPYVPVVYQGLEIYDEKNDYAREHDIKTTVEGTDADNDIGIIERIRSEDASRMSYPFLKLMTRDEFPAYRQWFYNRSGKHVPFWWVDHVRAFKLVAGTAFDSIFLTVKSLGYGEFAFTSPTRKNIAIRLPSGAWAYRQIIAAVVNLDGTTTLTMDSAPGETLAVEDNPLISLLRKVRLDSDTLEITWETSNVLRTATRFIDVF